MLSKPTERETISSRKTFTLPSPRQLKLMKPSACLTKTTMGMSLPLHPLQHHLVLNGCFRHSDISRAEIKTTLVKTYRERRFLSHSMRDAGQALRTLDRILLAFALVVLFFISLSVFNVNVTQSLSSVYTIGIAASFFFKNAASNAFDAIMFLFVTQ